MVTALCRANPLVACCNGPWNNHTLWNRHSSRTCRVCKSTSVKNPSDCSVGPFALRLPTASDMPARPVDCSRFHPRSRSTTLSNSKTVAAMWPRIYKRFVCRATVTRLVGIACPKTRCSKPRRPRLTPDRLLPSLSQNRFFLNIFANTTMVYKGRSLLFCP